MGKLALQAENLLMLRNEKPFIVNRKINAWFNVNWKCINVYQGNSIILTIFSVHKFLQLIVSNIAPSFPEGKVPFKADGAHFCSKVLKTQKKQTKVVVRQFSLIQAQKNGEKRRKNGVACLTSTSLHAVSK